MIAFIIKTFGLLFVVSGLLYIYAYGKERKRIHIASIMIYLALGYIFLEYVKMNDTWLNNIIFGSLLIITIIQVIVFRIIKRNY